MGGGRVSGVVDGVARGKGNGHLPAVDPEIGRPSVEHDVEGLSRGAYSDGPYESVVWINKHDTDWVS